MLEDFLNDVKPTWAECSSELLSYRAVRPSVRKLSFLQRLQNRLMDFDETL